MATDNPPSAGGYGPDDYLPGEQDTRDLGDAWLGPQIFEPSGKPGGISGPQGTPPASANANNLRRAPSPWDQPASDSVDRFLIPTERFRGEWRKHWIYIINHLAIAAVATVIAGWLAGILAKHNEGGLLLFFLIVLVGILLWVGWKILDWYLDRFILTNKRLMEVKGFFTKTVAMMPLLRVTDMKYTQSPLGRILGYGDFLLESAGQDQALRKIDKLPNPNELYLRIVEEMYEPEAVEARATAGPNEPGSTEDGM